MTETNKALETLENNLSSKEKLMGNELEVKNAIKLIIIEAERGDKKSQEVLSFVMETANKNKQGHIH